MSLCPQPVTTHPSRPEGIAASHELWRLHGATDDLRGLAVETSFGYALALELAGEIVLLHLQPSLEVLVAYAERLEVALRGQGWITRPQTSARDKETA